MQTVAAPHSVGSRENPQFRSPVLAAVINVAVFTSSWTGVAVGSNNLVDYVLLLAGVLLVFEALVGRRIILSPWMLAPTVGVLISVGIDYIFRLKVYDPASVTYLERMALATLLVAVLVLSEAVTGGEPRLRRIVVWWAHGVTLNALAAYGISHGYLTLTFVQSETGTRLSGLSSHPNSLAFSLVIALPTYTYLMTTATTRRARLMWLASIVVAVEGLVLADSRSGYIFGLGALVVALGYALFNGGMRRAAPLLAAGSALVLYLYVLPILTTGTRLAAGAGVNSDTGRRLFNGLAWSAFQDNIFIGSGFANQNGVAAPLQLLSAGGLLLALFYYSFYVVILRHFRVGGGSVAVYGAIATVVAAGFGIFQPGSAERATFWVPLAFATMLWLRRGKRENGSISA